MPVTAIQRMPFLDVTTLAPNLLRKASELFDQMRDQDLLPACMATDDPVRKKLDRRVLRDVLELDWSTIEAPLDLLRRKWCAEPSVRAGKPVAARGARSP